MPYQLPANRKPSPRRLEVPPAPPSPKRLAQARAFAQGFKLETLTPEDLRRVRRSAYAYLI